MDKLYLEDEHAELKRTFNDSVIKEIVAFLNTDGGIVFIGVEDDGKVCGVPKLDETLKKVADIVEAQILPDCRDLVELGTRYENGKHVVVVKVARGANLFYIKKYGRSAQGCFVRVGTTCRSMTEQQIENAHNRYLATKTSITEMASKMKTFTFQYLRMMLVEKGLNVNEATFEENFHLRTSFGEHNKMAELLADRNEVSIKVVRFRGRDKADDIVMRNEYGDKCLLVAMRQAYDYCADVVNITRTRMVRDERREQRLFDNEAFREAWFNACLHNNWVDGTPPAISVFDDRMEIISTGGLPANLSKEEFFKGVSKPVNEELARLFIRLDLMEQTGHGVPLVVRQYGRDVFDLTDNFIKVTIPFAFELTDEPVNSENEPVNPKNEPVNPENEPVNPENGSVNSGNGPVNPENGPVNPENGPVNGPVNEDEAENETVSFPLYDFFKLIKAHPGVNRVDLMGLSSRSRATVGRYVKMLTDMKKIEFRGSDKTGGYYPITDDKEKGKVK